VPNLFIIDGSIFVTGACVNPTPTIQALALRTADYLKGEGRSILE
jgi:choline dehydrogenase-like flavoprotein